MFIQLYLKFSLFVYASTSFHPSCYLTQCNTMLQVYAFKLMSLLSFSKLEERGFLPL